MLAEGFYTSPTCSCFIYYAKTEKVASLISFFNHFFFILKTGSVPIPSFTHAVNTLRPRQKGRHFTDDIFKCIPLNENVWILIKISIPNVQIINILALVQIMAWCRSGDSHYLNQWWLDYWRIYASSGLNELKHAEILPICEYLPCSLFYPGMLT